MKEKLAIARKLRSSRKIFRYNFETEKLCLKCYRAYVFQCILKGKDQFRIVFNSSYNTSFLKRVSDWYHYIVDSIYRVYLMNFEPDAQTLRKYALIHSGVSKPLYLKFATAPDEEVLYDFLIYNGFNIVDEHLDSISTEYVVARKDNL